MDAVILLITTQTLTYPKPNIQSIPQKFTTTVQSNEKNWSQLEGEKKYLNSALGRIAGEEDRAEIGCSSIDGHRDLNAESFCGPSMTRLFLLRTIVSRFITVFVRRLVILVPREAEKACDSFEEPHLILTWERDRWKERDWEIDNYKGLCLLTAEKKSKRIESIESRLCCYCVATLMFLSIFARSLPECLMMLFILFNMKHGRDLCGLLRVSHQI